MPRLYFRTNFSIREVDAAFTNKVKYSTRNGNAYINIYSFINREVLTMLRAKNTSRIIDAGPSGAGLKAAHASGAAYPPFALTLRPRGPSLRWIRFL
jgi:hypothetical protein